MFKISVLRFTSGRYSWRGLAKSVVWFPAMMAIVLAGSGAATGSDAVDTSSDLVLQQTRIDEYLLSEKSLTVFTKALQTSRYWGDVKAADEITLFVTSNQSLQDEGSAFLLDLVLQKPENRERLDDVIGNHIVTGAVILDRQFTQSVLLKTTNGICVRISALDNAVKVGPESVLKRSVIADNGSIFFIDRLLWAPYDDSESVKSCE